jgi:hypothetical protein
MAEGEVLEKIEMIEMAETVGLGEGLGKIGAAELEGIWMVVAIGKIETTKVVGVVGTEIFGGSCARFSVFAREISNCINSR